MYLKILTAFAALALLCACSTVSLSGTESLMVAPKLNKQQAEVAQAFESTLSSRAIVYKPPQSGDYRSPFVFYDIDGDGLDEAIVFYAFSGSDVDSGSVRATVLKQTSDGRWRLFYDVASPTQGSEVEFVKFERLLSTQSSCVVIGWKAATINKSSSLAVYSIKDNAFPIEAYSDYLNYSIEDFNRDGLGELAIIAHDNAYDRFKLSLWRSASGGFEETAGIELSSEVGAPVSMTTGILWDGYRGLYIDELLSGGATTYATEIVRVNSAGLTLLAGGESAYGDDADDPVWDNYVLTFRDEEILCLDINGDGTVEVPHPAVTLPGPVEVSETSATKLVPFMQLTGDGFKTYYTAVINDRDGYLVCFPERWLNSVTVETGGETGEWHFRKWNENAQSAAEELLRVRMVSKANESDVFGGDYVELARKGAAVYSAYIPALPGDELGVTEQEVREMFKLI